MLDADEIKEVSSLVMETLKNDFVEVKILDVGVTSDVDFDGDDILRIEVVFEGSSKAIESGVFSSAVRHIRPKLDDISVRAFPLFSFISDKEVKGTKLAAI